MHGEVRIVADVAAAFAELVADLAPSSIALSGGSTAQHAYEQLATRAFDWRSTDVYFGDERWIPVDHADSNEGMARAALLDRVQPRAIHSLRNAGNTIDAAARAYDDTVAAAPPIELIHLGLGPDGHTASLFPGSPALGVYDRLVVPNGDDLHPHPRLTFTYPALTRSHLVVFTVGGASKHGAFSRVRAGDDLPAARVTAGKIVWLVDRAAAG